MGCRWKILFSALLFGTMCVVYLNLLGVHNDTSDHFNVTVQASDQAKSDNNSTSRAGHEDDPIISSSDHVVDSQQYLDFVHQQCEKYDKSTSDKERPRLMLLPRNYGKYGILYASNPKSGSTTFKKWFLRLQGSKQEYVDMAGVTVSRVMAFGELMAHYDPSTPILQLVEPYFKVGFVRNPLTRLISAFRDKIARRYYYMGTLRKHDPSLTRNSSDVDKFRAFVEIIATGKLYNMHWNQQWSNMKVCDWPYHFLGQTETTREQMKIVQQHTGTERFEFPGSRAEQGLDSVATVQLAHELYDGIDEEVMGRLYKRFQWDFVLMGYSKLDNPNFPYIDLDQDFDQNFKLYS